jgi:hypothetical protein
MAFGLGYWHWFFLAQPYDLPERLLAAEPEKTLFRGGSEAFAPEAMKEYVRCLRDPETIHATCEDYRAAATVDFAHDAEDREARRRMACPVLALWGRQGFLEEHYDVLDVWRGWAEEVRGRALDCGHYLPEEAPEETYAELRVFFGEKLLGNRVSSVGEFRKLDAERVLKDNGANGLGGHGNERLSDKDPSGQRRLRERHPCDGGGGGAL